MRKLEVVTAEAEPLEMIVEPLVDPMTPGLADDQFAELMKDEPELAKFFADSPWMPAGERSYQRAIPGFILVASTYGYSVTVLR